MIGPDQDLSQFPPWIWPYIRTTDLAKSKIFTWKEQLATTQLPEAVVFGRAVAIVQAVQLKVIAERIGQADMAKAAGRVVADEIDDFCGTKPHPFPPRAAELAGHLAVLAASYGEGPMRTELAGAVDQIAAHGR